MTFLNDFGLTLDLAIILAIDLTIAVILLALMRYLQGWSVRVNSRAELAERDNFAFGVSTAGAVLALGIVLSGAITGEAADSYIVEAIGMTAYGLFGLLLIKFGRVLHDKIALNEIDKNSQIINGNMSVAIVDAAAAVATAIIIRSVLMWAEDITLDTFIAIFTAFLISQLMLVLLTRFREHQYAKRNQDASMQKALEQGQIAVAIRHSGYMIAMAFTFKAASHFIIYDPTAYLMNIVGWLTFSIIMLVVLSLLLAVVKKLVLAQINLTDEVEKQHNVGVAAVELAISVAVALILAALMA
ncbi:MULTISPECIES: DUF350 domain-containing protein [unclassified Shewanella]|uniref:DUF350 domain-containing protein n=1 Tax=unclassified Shewanella TaxID=196818 RepID=UPI000C85873A|nr:MULTISPECIES: DUF350 domain-containing protein [unclassified Shewanella]MDO6619725.1 DUF350 domain-containing protein [Shewanella sp. 6_MG-2023]MDO6638655.1 DUF350 domain-containing protein [Shewanella sp. 5_MG-2023]MDO6680139.1 DUF350 domain-containing protein [Shewanella sp. 4_MG-2023]PMG32194.1 hypothetical protein BCU94_00230 [Shewanella sp. 10N.286.52.C2]PMG48654.1 hypothetical protein BCU91_18770 [Shewanella sp. 10N.286.52.B9]